MSRGSGAVGPAETFSVRFREVRQIGGALYVRMMLSSPGAVEKSETRMFCELREIVATPEGGRWWVSQGFLVVRT